MPICPELTTPRLSLRPWRHADAAGLHAILQANHDRLEPWIPAGIADPATPALLAERLARFALDFAADQEWRYAIVIRAGGQLIGELSVFPRSATGRVPFPDADRVELGYWLRREATGLGYVTEAVRGMLAVVQGVPQFRHVEIHCDTRNAPSAAVPRRLGFTLAPDEAQIQVWRLASSPGD
jgi:RimJ/RimL family protein N-acetyltransferase